VFTPVLAKHSKSFSLIDCVSVGVDRMQRNFEPMREQLEAWQRSELTDVTAKVVIYEAFVEGKLEAPRHLARTVHELYFEPKYEEFRPRTIWSLSNAFTSAFKELDPIPQFKATAKLGEFLETRFSQSFWSHTGDPELQRAVVTQVEHIGLAIGGSLLWLYKEAQIGRWRFSDSIRFERSYTLEEAAGQHEPRTITARVSRMLPT
jgi:hypothetical protein